MDQQLAGRGSRLGAVLVDNVCAVLALIPGGVALLSAVDSYGNDGMGAALVLLAAGLLGLFGIQIYLLVQKGQTLGKRFVGIRIVDHENGSLLGAGRILGMRGALPGLILGIPYAGWLFPLVDVLFIFGEDRRCIHDYMAQSKVIAGKAAESTTDDPVQTTDAAQDGNQTTSTSLQESARNGETARRVEGDTSSQTRGEPLPAKPSSTDQLRGVLQNLKELRKEKRITEEKLEQSRREALVGFVEETNADPEVLLSELRRLAREGYLEASDVQTAKSIL